MAMSCLFYCCELVYTTHYILFLRADNYVQRCIVGCCAASVTMAMGMTSIQWRRQGGCQGCWHPSARHPAPARVQGAPRPGTPHPPGCKVSGVIHYAFVETGICIHELIVACFTWNETLSVIKHSATSCPRASICPRIEITLSGHTMERGVAEYGSVFLLMENSTQQKLRLSIRLAPATDLAMVVWLAAEFDGH